MEMYSGGMPPESTSTVVVSGGREAFKRTSLLSQETLQQQGPREEKERSLKRFPVSPKALHSDSTPRERELFKELALSPQGALWWQCPLGRGENLFEEFPCFPQGPPQWQYPQGGKGYSLKTPALLHDCSIMPKWWHELLGCFVIHGQFVQKGRAWTGFSQMMNCPNSTWILISELVHTQPSPIPEWPCTELHLH